MTFRIGRERRDHAQWTHKVKERVVEKGQVVRVRPGIIWASHERAIYTLKYDELFKIYYVDRDIPFAYGKNVGHIDAEEVSLMQSRPHIVHFEAGGMDVAINIENIMDIEEG